MKSATRLSTNATIARQSRRCCWRLGRWRLARAGCCSVEAPSGLQAIVAFGAGALMLLGAGVAWLTRPSLGDVGERFAAELKGAKPKKVVAGDDPVGQNLCRDRREAEPDHGFGHRRRAARLDRGRLRQWPHAIWSVERHLAARLRPRRRGDRHGAELRAGERPLYRRALPAERGAAWRRRGASAAVSRTSSAPATRRRFDRSARCRRRCALCCRRRRTSGWCSSVWNRNGPGLACADPARAVSRPATGNIDASQDLAGAHYACRRPPRRPNGVRRAASISSSIPKAAPIDRRVRKQLNATISRCASCNLPDPEHCAGQPRDRLCRFERRDGAQALRVRDSGLAGFFIRRAAARSRSSRAAPAMAAGATSAPRHPAARYAHHFIENTSRCAAGMVQRGFAEFNATALREGLQDDE